MAKRQQVKTFTFTQKINDIGMGFWDWTDAEKLAHFTDPVNIMRHICSRIFKGLSDAGETGEDLNFEFSGINHDSDMTKAGNTYLLADEHLHCVVTLSKKRDLNVIASWVGLDKVRFDVAKGRYGKNNFLAYLIHAKDPDKHQYSPYAVETFGTFDYIEYYEIHMVDWQRRSATVKTKRNKESAQWLVHEVQVGNLTKQDIMDNEEYKYIYADNMRLINDAFQFNSEDKGYKTLRAMIDGEFEITVLFVTGESNAGKTATAKLLTSHLKKINGWETYNASASNPFDSYKGEEIMFLDDIRPYSISATSWLQLLDVLGEQTIDARYYNKMRAYRVLIMTSPVENPYTFFSQVRGTRDELEPLDQFIRRLSGHIHVVRSENGDRYASFDKIGRSEHLMLFDEFSEEFIKNADTIELSNGVPLLSKSEHTKRKEVRGGLRMLNFGAVPYSEGIIDSNQTVGVMGDVLKEIEINNDPNINHREERPSMDDIRRQKVIKDTASQMGLSFQHGLKGDD